jgi:cephalosporin hydroxylase
MRAPSENELRPLPNWDLGETWGTFTKGTFHGVIQGAEIQKSADDLLRYEELIDISQPDIVVETGTRAGGSAIWFRQQGLQVVSIDIAPQFTRGEPSQPGITFIRGSSIHPVVIGDVMPLIKGKRVMVSLDSDHASAHVQAEMSIWAQFVTPGCYMVVEDACFDLFDRAGQPDWARVGGNSIPEYGGTLHAIETSGIAHSPMWWRDEALEGRTNISHSPVGYWRKHE